LNNGGRSNMIITVFAILVSSCLNCATRKTAELFVMRSSRRTEYVYNRQLNK